MYKRLAQAVADLERHGHLIRITEEVDPYLQMAEIQRRVFAAKGPALYFERVKGTDIPAVSNLFGTMERARFLFRHTLAAVQKLIQLKSDPMQLLKNPMALVSLPGAGFHALPKCLGRRPATFKKIEISQLPLIQSWPKDGGAFITLPQVFSRNPQSSGVMQSNLGMYRVQLTGNRYDMNRQIGLHYQIHRGIGVHHALAREQGEPLKVSIFIGGPPAHTFAAMMPLPEGISELTFAGVLAGRRFRYFEEDGFVLSADADFVITGVIEDTLLPEGPFGDHLGYYSLQHEFPVLRVEKVYQNTQAIWPFTVVGRPPQEDTIFGQMVHEITGPVIPQTIPGLHAVHAVDAAGVHPLLLALGSERYVPYAKREPQELLTIAHAVLGFGQLSLAKYLLIAAREDAPNLDIQNIPDFFQHLLERIDWRRDLHFQTQTTMDTLDYSAEGLNKGSKVVMAAAGVPVRTLSSKLPGDKTLPQNFTDWRVILPGIVAIGGPEFSTYEHAAQDMELLEGFLKELDTSGLPLIVVTDDVEFTTRTLNNALWVTFTRSDPAADIYGVDAFTTQKHWGCRGPLIIDARIKPHHAPPLETDPKIAASVEALAAPGKSLHGII